MDSGERGQTQRERAAVCIHSPPGGRQREDSCARAVRPPRTDRRLPTGRHWPRGVSATSHSEPEVLQAAPPGLCQLRRVPATLSTAGTGAASASGGAGAAAADVGTSEGTWA